MANRIIIIDDDSFFRSLAKDILEHNGFEVVLASNVENFALSYSSQLSQPDMILFDINLGTSISGDKLLASFKESLKKTDPSAGTKLVIMSGLSDEELKELASKCGADGYIRKSSLNIDYGGFIFSNKVRSFLENRDDR